MWRLPAGERKNPRAAGWTAGGWRLEALDRYIRTGLEGGREGSGQSAQRTNAAAAANAGRCCLALSIIISNGN